MEFPCLSGNWDLLAPAAGRHLPVAGGHQPGGSLSAPGSTPGMPGPATAIRTRPPPLPNGLSATSPSLSIRSPRGATETRRQHARAPHIATGRAAESAVESAGTAKRRG